MRILALFSAVLLAFAPAQAAETAWQQVAPDVNMRLISAGKVSVGNTALFALEIDMPDTTKTYWRVPGETGLPTELDVSGSSGVMGHAIRWPYPTVDHKPDYLDYAYFGHTVLPIEVNLNDASGRLNLTATLGICSEICIPAQASFELPLTDAAPDRSNALRIKQAIAESPMEWDGAAEPLGGVELMPDASAIGIWISDPGVDPMSLIAATDKGEPLFGTPQKSPQPNLVLLPILGKTDDIALDGMDVQLTFMTDMGAFEVSRTIEVGD